MVLLEEVLDISTKLLNSSSEQQVIDIERLSAAGSDAWPALPVLLHITLRGGNRAVQLQALKLLERGTIGGSTIVATLAAALLRVESEGIGIDIVHVLACHSGHLQSVRDTLIEVVRVHGPSSDVAEELMQVMAGEPSTVRGLIQTVLGWAPPAPDGPSDAFIHCVSVVRDNAGNVPSAIVPLLTHYACSASYTRVARRAALRGLAALGADAADAAAHVLTLAESTVDEATMALDVLAQIGPTIAPQCLARLTVIVRAEDFRSVAALCAFAALAPHELPTLLPNESLGSRDLSGLILHEGINRPRHYGGRGLADAGYRLALVKAMEQWVEATIVAIQLDGHDRVHVGWGRAKCMWALERLADLEATESLATCLRSAFPVCAMYYHQELTELWGRYGEQSSHAAWTNMRSDELTQGDM